ncbi:putative complex I intermediate-associated protein 30-like protein, partial [Leptotrombidium deliense]
GPYWQDVRIPFSKFINSHKGRVQDDQRPYHMMNANEFGISLMDNNPGPFRLEIDYIGVEYDPAVLEESAYEMYRIDEFRYKV